MDKKEFFTRIYDVLVAHCGAQDDKYDRLSFVQNFTSERPSMEWRFQGALGFGGKFRYPRITVDCYPEDETPKRKEMIQRVNSMLEQIRLEYEKEQAKEAA